MSTALADLLPSPIAARHTKNDFTPDHYLGLRANAAVLRDLADGRLTERGLVDPDRLREHAAAGLSTFSDFEPVLAAEIWLHATDTAPAAAQWQPRTPPPESLEARTAGYESQFRSMANQKRFTIAVSAR